MGYGLVDKIENQPIDSVKCPF